MERFVTLTGLAAPLLMPNIDTDLIIPKQFLKTLVRTGLGAHLFHELRYDAEGRENPAFVLNREPWRHARILLAGPNAGCGSSREHAPWALLDFGIRCVVAPSFADIFHNNCFANGILPIQLPMEAVEALARLSGELTVDLPGQWIGQGELRFPFELEASRKTALLEGLDEIGRTEAALPAIEGFEAARRDAAPWSEPVPFRL